MTKRKVWWYVFLFFTFFVYAENTDPVHFLCGNWYKRPDPRHVTIHRYNWGEGKTILNSTLEIDLYGDNPHLNIPLIGGPFPITKVENADKNTISFTFFFDRGGCCATYLVHKLDKGAIWFEFLKGEEAELLPSFYDNGDKFLWYKIAGPSKNTQKRDKTGYEKLYQKRSCFY